MQLELPLFPGYVFVRLELRDRQRVVQIPSVVRAEPHPFLTVGRRVRITGGPFAGLEGVLKRRKSNFRVVVSLDLIQRSVAVAVDAGDVLALDTRTN